MGNAESSENTTNALKQQAISRLGAVLKEQEADKALEEGRSCLAADINEPYSPRGIEGSLQPRPRSNSESPSINGSIKKRKTENKSAQSNESNASSNNSNKRRRVRRTAAKRSAANSQLLKEMANFKVIIPPELKEETASRKASPNHAHNSLTPMAADESHSCTSKSNITDDSTRGEDTAVRLGKSTEPPPKPATTLSVRIPNPPEKRSATLDDPATQEKVKNYSSACTPVGKLRGLPMASKKTSPQAIITQVSMPPSTPGCPYIASPDPIENPHEHDGTCSDGCMDL